MKAAANSARVYGGLRPGEQLRRRPFLHHLAVAHDHEPARQGGDHPQVVGDEEVGEIAPLLQGAQQVDDLRLDQHVERAGRLVEHDEGRLQHDRAGDRDALALAAGKFVRIAEPRLGIEADIVQGADHAALALLGRHVGMMHPQPFLDDVGDRHARAERAVGVLEHDLHVAAERPHLLEVQALQLLAEEHDRALRRK